MERLGWRQARYLFEFLIGLYALREQEALIQYVLQRLPIFVSHDLSAYTEADVASRYIASTHWPEEPFGAQQLEVFAKFMHQHPLIITHYHALGMRPPTRSLTFFQPATGSELIFTTSSFDLWPSASNGFCPLDYGLSGGWSCLQSRREGF